MKSIAFHATIITLCCITLYCASAFGQDIPVAPGISAPSSFTDIGTAGILTILILREVFEYLKKRDRKNEDVTILDIRKKVDELHSWHNQRDADGIPVWYVKQSMHANIDKLTDVMALQTQTLAQIVVLLQRIDARIDKLEEN